MRSHSHSHSHTTRYHSFASTSRGSMPGCTQGLNAEVGERGEREPTNGPIRFYSGVSSGVGSRIGKPPAPSRTSGAGSAIIAVLRCLCVRNRILLAMGFSFFFNRDTSQCPGTQGRISDRKESTGRVNSWGTCENRNRRLSRD